MKAPLLLYQYPKSWFFLDDHEPFLEAIELSIPSHQPYKLWENPLLCLQFLLHLGRLRDEPIGLEHFGSSSDDVIVKYELDKLARFVTNGDRFASPSVLVVDYAMPGMNGLELLEKLNDRSFKTILLTGAADEKVAVEAFNSGLIDRFVLKSDPQAVQKTLLYCEDLSTWRLHEAQHQLIGLLPESIRQIFNSEACGKTVLEEFKRRGIREYYFSLEPIGIYGLDLVGKPVFLSLVLQEELSKQIDFLRGCRIPKKYLTDLESKQVVTCLFEPFSSEHADSYDWDFNSISLQPIEGAPGVRWGIHENPPMDVDYDAMTCSLNQFLSETPESSL